MTRFAQLWRTTTVRLTAIFVLIFVAFSVLLLAVISYQSSIQIQRQQAADIDREIAQIARLDDRNGFRASIMAVERMSRQPGPGVYYIGDPTGQIIVGNVANLPSEVLMEPGTYTFNYDRQRPSDADLDLEGVPPPPQGNAMVRSVVLPSGLHLVVGRDIFERRGFTAIILQSFLIGVSGIVLLSIVAGLFNARRVLRRIDTINDTTAKIMKGSMSERIPITSRRDEFDGLAESLNAMLDRIEQLMQGLKEVTDNVAHDLKTPLTRLRNQAESALRDSAGEDDRRQALETTISESDKLIRTFNALLMIARAEAGAPSGAFADVDISAIAADVAELYAPVAEEEGMELVSEVAPGIRLRANRELIGQALVNLVDNAIKYYEPQDGRTGVITVTVRQTGDRVRIEVADNGPGIPAEDRERVIERFVRLQASRTSPGSGLGLSLVAAVARVHKGEFRIEDNDPGVRAVIDLPI